MSGKNGVYWITVCLTLILVVGSVAPIADFADNDLNGNGIPDDKEVAVDLDLDNDGVLDSQQTDIKCVDSKAEDVLQRALAVLEKDDRWQRK